ncbi:MAG: hypothetical protein B6229_05645 [Spirochaetaceae bacterium 4572_7]|nr:MAG: hypothetical protein B6229_05645 [Spirochaetaceae bacterium 4572_7]
MDNSKFYSKSISKVFKKNFDKDLSTYKSEFTSIFVSCCHDFSEDTAIELYHKFVTHSSRDFKDALYNLVNLFELFEENYDLDTDPFLEEEWEYIKLIVNDSGDEFELDTVKYIMQVMLDLDYV